MATQTTPVFTVQRAAERARFDFGWLETHHSFSFADYFDPENLNWGALRVFNDDTVQPGQGFGTHPHRDMEIITYVLRGEVEHRDSLGQHGVVAPGGIQYISAGTGVRHSEFNHSKERDVHFVQMWVLPRSYGEPPAYGQHAFDEERAAQPLARRGQRRAGRRRAGDAARRCDAARGQARGRRADACVRSGALRLSVRRRRRGDGQRRAAFGR